MEAGNTVAAGWNHARSGQQEESNASAGLIEFEFSADGNFGKVASDLTGGEWFVSDDPPAMVKIDEHTGHFSTFAMPHNWSGPDALTLSPQHDAMWFTDPDDNAVGYMTLSNHTFRRFKLPTVDSFPGGIVAGPDNAMWFTELNTSKIGRIGLAGHTITEYSDPALVAPHGITLGPDSALWFADSYSVGRITTEGDIQLYSIGENEAEGITNGADGGVWFSGLSDQNGSLLGRIDPYTHVRKIYKYRAGSGGTGSIALRGSDLWMTEDDSTKIDHFDVSTRTLYVRQLPHGYFWPIGIAIGADDQVWFTNYYKVKTKVKLAIGKLCPGLSDDQCKGARQ
jgi:virginiamycin B lyase